MVCLFFQYFLDIFEKESYDVLVMKNTKIKKSIYLPNILKVGFKKRLISNDYIDLSGIVHVGD